MGGAHEAEPAEQPVDEQAGEEEELELEDVSESESSEAEEGGEGGGAKKKKKKKKVGAAQPCRAARQGGHAAMGTPSQGGRLGQQGAAHAFSANSWRGVGGPGGLAAAWARRGAPHHPAPAAAGVIGAP